MYTYIVVVLLVSCMEVMQTSAHINNGKCTKTRAKTIVISKTYLKTCHKYHRTCWGWNKLEIDCKDKFINTTCTEIRHEYYTTYEVEYVCCPGFVKDNIHTTFSCTKGCPGEYYGQNCSVPCHCPLNAYKNCDKNNGTCTCTAGWTGLNCTEGCPDGYFGDGCENVCPCRNNATCNSSDGSCICTKPGWTGIHCDKETAAGKTDRNVAPEESSIKIGVSVGVLAIVVVIAVVVVVMLRKKFVVKKLRASSNPVSGLVKRKDDVADSTKDIQRRDNKVDSNEGLQDRDDVYSALHHNGHKSDLVDVDSKNVYGHLHMQMEGTSQEDAYDAMKIIF